MMPNAEWKTALQNAPPASVQATLMSDGLESLRERLEARKFARNNSVEPTRVFTIAGPTSSEGTGSSIRSVQSNGGSLMPGEKGSNHRRRMNRRRHQRPSDPGPTVHALPKGILKKQSTTTDVVSRKRVSFSDALSRWNSEGSSLYLKSLTSKQACISSKDLPKGNCQWGTEKTKKSKSAIGLSMLGKQLGDKHQAPLRPNRRGSVQGQGHAHQAPFLPERRDSIETPPKTLSANVFRASLADFQSKLAMDMAGSQNNHEESLNNAPTRPTRRASKEIDRQAVAANVA